MAGREWELAQALLTHGDSTVTDLVRDRVRRRVGPVVFDGDGAALNAQVNRSRVLGSGSDDLGDATAGDTACKQGDGERAENKSGHK